MSNAKPTLWSLIGVALTGVAPALIIYRAAGGPFAWWLPLSMLVVSVLLPKFR